MAEVNNLVPIRSVTPNGEISRNTAIPAVKSQKSGGVVGWQTLPNIEHTTLEQMAQPQDVNTSEEVFAPLTQEEQDLEDYRYNVLNHQWGVSGFHEFMAHADKGQLDLILETLKMKSWEDIERAARRERAMLPDFYGKTDTDQTPEITPVRYLGGVPLEIDPYGPSRVECLSGDYAYLHVDDRYIRIAKEKDPRIQMVAEVNSSEYGDLSELSINIKKDAQGNRDPDFDARTLTDYAIRHFESKNNIRGYKAIWQREYPLGIDPTKPADTFVRYQDQKAAILERYLSEGMDEKSALEKAKLSAAANIGLVKILRTGAYGYDGDLIVREIPDPPAELDHVIVITLKKSIA